MFSSVLVICVCIIGIVVILAWFECFNLIGGDVIMVGMIVAVCIISLLFLTMAATVFCELPRNARDVFCFLVMLAVSVSTVLVFVPVM